MGFQQKWILLFPLLLVVIHGEESKGFSSVVNCGLEEMEVTVEGKAARVGGAHVLGLKEYPDGSCQAEPVGNFGFRFRFSFSDFYRCGTTQIRNKLTGTRTFYNRIVVETGDSEEEVLVKCSRGNQYAAVLDNSQRQNGTSRQRRDILPAGFKEDPNLVPITEQIGKAPEPMLSMIVKREGQRIGAKLIVEPGAPLTMEVSLDPVSKDIYGILLSQLDVTDTGSQSEVLFHNGCSVDTYLFENFGTVGGDVLEGKFKAFKFPDTNYVLFRGTINVCLNNCVGIRCSNGQTGYGRRRREIPDYDYEIHTAAILQVGATNKTEDHPTLAGSSAKQTLTTTYGATRVESEALSAGRRLLPGLALSLLLLFTAN